jgi:hypothetical protein
VSHGQSLRRITASSLRKNGGGVGPGFVVTHRGGAERNETRSLSTAGMDRRRPHVRDRGSGRSGTNTLAPQHPLSEVVNAPICSQAVRSTVKSLTRGNSDRVKLQIPTKQKCLVRLSDEPAIPDVRLSVVRRRVELTCKYCDEGNLFLTRRRPDARVGCGSVPQVSAASAIETSRRRNT